MIDLRFKASRYNTIMQGEHREQKNETAEEEAKEEPYLIERQKMETAKIRRAWKQIAVYLQYFLVPTRIIS